MYQAIIFIVWIVLLVLPFIKPYIFREDNQSENNYLQSIKDIPFLSFIFYNVKGITENWEVFIFLKSLLYYTLITLLVSSLWIIFLPVLVLFLIIKKLLKNKSK